MGSGSSTLSNKEIQSYGGLNSVKAYVNVKTQLDKANANKTRLEKNLSNKAKQARNEIKKVQG